MRRVFVSYARKDTVRILPVVHALEREGFSVFRDNQIKVTEGWKTRLDTEIRGADALIVLWSANAIASSEVLREVDLANELEKAVVHCLIDTGVQPPTPYSALNAANLTLWTGNDHGYDHWRQICDSLGGGNGGKTGRWQTAAPSENQLLIHDDLVNQFTDSSTLTAELRKALKDGYAIHSILPDTIVLNMAPTRMEVWRARLMRKILGEAATKQIANTDGKAKTLILQYRRG